MQLLAGPRHPAGAERVKPEMLNHLIRLIRSRSSFLIADLASQLNDAMLRVLAASDLILLMLAPELASVHSVVETLDTFAALDFPGERVRLVLNRIFARGALTPGQIQSAIGVSIDLVIPHEPEVVQRAINTGEPFVLTNPNSAATRAVQDFAYSLGQPSLLEESESTPLAKAVRARMKAKPS